MAEYIDRQATISRFEQLKEQADTLHDKLYLDGVLAVIDAMPDANAREHIRGRWIRSPSEVIGVDTERCSICGCEMNERNQFWNANFCPHCGARMDGGDSNG